MGKRKTEKQVKEEVAKLIEMKPFVREFTAFGDSNHERIDCEIRALKEDMDEDKTYDEWPEDEADMEKRNAAQYVIQWRDGDEDEAPSKGWESLDSRKNKAKKS